MPSDPDPIFILQLAEYHLSRVLDYNPYKKFSGVSDRESFRQAIANDPAFAPLGLDDTKYIIARIGGNLVTSLHRKIGDMYEAIFKYLIACRFDLTENELKYNVVVTIGQRHQIRSTDGIIPCNRLINTHLPLLNVAWQLTDGLAFEVRSCYQIGDSKRIQADWDMAIALEQQNFTPIMLVFCSTSLRSPLIRLRESWNLFEAEEAFNFVTHLTEFDLKNFLQENQTVLKNLVLTTLANL